MPLDKEHLAKLIGLAASDNDHEALVALRKANAYLKEHNMTWAEALAESLFNQISIEIRPAPPAHPREEPKPQDGWVAPHLSDKATLELMFKTIFALPRGGGEEFWQWMDHIHHTFQEHGSLTPKQYTGLRNSYNRALRSSRG